MKLWVTLKVMNVYYDITIHETKYCCTVMQDSIKNFLIRLFYNYENKEIYMGNEADCDTKFRFDFCPFCGEKIEIKQGYSIRDE